MSERPKKILIVEDDTPLLEILQDRFKNEGFDVLTAKDGAEGLKMALDKQPDVILLDIVMPKVGGLTMLKNLRTYPSGKNIRVIVTTNLNDSKEIHEALSLGAHDFLVKSDWSLADLVATVSKQLDEPSAFTNSFGNQ